MATQLNCYAGLVLFMTIAVLGVSGNCDNAAFNQCITPMMRYSSSAQTGISYTEQQFDDICRTMEQVNACVKPVVTTCPETVTLIWTGMEDAFDYMCGPAMDVYLEHQSCFASSTLQNSLKTCNTTLASQTQTLTRKASSMKPEQIKRDTCKLMNTFVKCIYNSVEGTCGEDAAIWQQDVTGKLLKPTLKGLDCTLAGVTARISMLLLVAALLAVLVM